MSAPAMVPMHGQKMFRTYFEMDPLHPATRGFLVDAHKAHRLTMSMFAYLLEDNDFYSDKKITNVHPNHRMSHNILWGANYGRGSHPSVTGATPDRVRVIVTATSRPKLDYWRCEEWTDALLSEPVIKEITPTASLGDKIQYQVVINPRTNVRHNKVRRTTVATHEDQIQEWWAHRASSAGLRLLDRPSIDQPGEYTSEIKDQLKIKHARVTGNAEIIDPEKYLDALAKGVGPAKSYGCGMLLTR